jgi:hypothetical protein
MKTITEHIRDHLLEMSGFSVQKPKAPSLEELYRTEWNPEFIQLMRNRLVMGFFRYGYLKDCNTSTEAKMKSMRKRLDMYEEDGNLEHMVDNANIALAEFMHSNHPNRHFSASDDGTHIKK